MSISNILAVNFAVAQYEAAVVLYPTVSLSLSVSRCKANWAVAGVVCCHHFRFSTNYVSTEGSFSFPYIVMEDINFGVYVCLGCVSYKAAEWILLKICIWTEICSRHWISHCRGDHCSGPATEAKICFLTTVVDSTYLRQPLFQLCSLGGSTIALIPLVINRSGW